MATIDYQLVIAFQLICDKAAKKLNVDKVIADIVSGCRCKWWNGKEGGKFTSKHQYGQAIDFRIRGLTSADLAKLAEENIDKDLFDYYMITNTNFHLEYDPK